MPERREPLRVVKALRAERERQEITQDELAARLSVAGVNASQGVVSRWETGHVTPRLITLEIWAQALGMTIMAVRNPEG